MSPNKPSFHYTSNSCSEILRSRSQAKNLYHHLKSNGDGSKPSIPCIKQFYGFHTVFTRFSYGFHMVASQDEAKMRAGFPHHFHLHLDAVCPLGRTACHGMSATEPQTTVLGSGSSPAKSMYMNSIWLVCG